MNETTTQQEMINKCFTYWNSLKRHRALSEIRKGEGRREDSTYHNLQMYKMSEMLELALRALQRGQREIDTTDSSEGDSK